MRILITGAAGFIGSFLARALIQCGDVVVGIDNFDPYYPRKAKEFNLDLTRLAANSKPEKFSKKELEPVFDKLLGWGEDSKEKKAGKFKFHELDIRDYEGLEKLFRDEKIDKIVHLAAMAGVPYSLENPRKYVEVNIDGTVNLLNLSAKHKIKNFIFASSSSVYGATKEVPFREDQNVDNPISPYAATKRMGETMCYTFSHLFDLPITCLRFFTVYGPLQRPYGMAIQKFIKLVDHAKPMTIYGDGKMGRDFTYVDDTVHGIIAALDKPQKFEIYNLGNSYPITVNELADLIKKIMRKGERTYLEKPPTEVPVTYADISKAKKDLNYNPEVKIEEGLKRQIKVYGMMGEWYKSGIICN